jgi:hypothetical protein
MGVAPSPSSTEPPPATTVEIRAKVGWGPVVPIFLILGNGFLVVASDEPLWKAAAGIFVGLVFAWAIWCKARTRVRFDDDRVAAWVYGIPGWGKPTPLTVEYQRLRVHRANGTYWFRSWTSWHLTDRQTGQHVWVNDIWFRRAERKAITDLLAERALLDDGRQPGLAD